MLKLTDRHLNYTASVALADLPADWQRVLRDYGALHGGRRFDETEGGYYLVPEWLLLQWDRTGEDALDALLASGDAAGYPYAGWREAGFARLADYIAFLQALRFIAANVPLGALGRHKLAVHVRT
jgi:hypothetical protein